MKNFLLIFFTLCFLNSFAQIRVGYIHTPNGKAIYEDYHSYFGSELGGIKFKLEKEFDLYEKGIYKLKTKDQLYKAYINFTAERIVAKVDTVEFPKKQKIVFEKIEYVKLGRDSFFVVDKIKNDKKTIEKKSLVKHIASFDTIIYAQYYNYSKLNGSLKNKFFIEKKKNSNIWNRIVLKGEPLKRNFFMPFGAVNRFIDKKEVTEEEFLKTVKEQEYFDKFTKGAKFYYDNTWSEIKKSKDAVFSAEVVEKKDSIYTVNYFNFKKEKLYNVHYSSFNPNKKTGKLTVYKGGKIKEERIYSNDSLKSLSYFDSEEKLKLRFENKIVKDKYNKDSVELVYTDYISENGDKKIKESDYFKTKFDQISVNHSFVSNKIVKSFYLENDQKIYFFNALKKDIDTYRFKSALEVYLRDGLKFKKARFKENLEGTILLDIKTNYKGKVVSYKILNSLGNGLDKFIADFCRIKMSLEANFVFKFKGIKLEDKKAFCRFLLPISFSHNRFNETFTRPNYDFHHQMFHQQMIWQQQIARPPALNGF